MALSQAQLAAQVRLAARFITEYSVTGDRQYVDMLDDALAGVAPGEMYALAVNAKDADYLVSRAFNSASSTVMAWYLAQPYVRPEEGGNRRLEHGRHDRGEEAREVWLRFATLEFEYLIIWPRWLKPLCNIAAEEVSDLIGDLGQAPQYQAVISGRPAGFNATAYAQTLLDIRRHYEPERWVDPGHRRTKALHSAVFESMVEWYTKQKLNDNWQAWWESDPGDCDFDDDPGVERGHMLMCTIYEMPEDEWMTDYGPSQGAKRVRTLGCIEAPLNIDHEGRYRQWQIRKESEVARNGAHNRLFDLVRDPEWKWADNEPWGQNPPSRKDARVWMASDHAKLLLRLGEE